MAISLSAMGLSAVCDCDTHLLFLGVIHANSDGFGESVHLIESEPSSQFKIPMW